jgi:hypothetical protein
MSGTWSGCSETNAAALAFTGLVFGITRNRKWLIVPSIVLPFLSQHAIQGWCPPVPVFRRLGVRTRDENQPGEICFKGVAR